MKNPRKGQDGGATWKTDHENGQVFKERIIECINLTPPEEFGALYRLLEEWQLLGFILTVLEGIEENG